MAIETKTGGDPPWKAEPVMSGGGYAPPPPQAPTASAAATPAAATSTAGPSGARTATDGANLRDRVRSLQLGKDVTATGGLGWIKWAVVLVVLLGGGWVAWQVFAGAKGSKPPGDGSAAAGSAPADAPLAAAKGDSAYGAVVLESKGYIIPVHEILVSPKIAGMVEKLDIIEGQRVTQGKVLAVLESVDYQADVARSKAMLAAAKQRLLEMENGSRPEEVDGAKAELAESEAQAVQLKSQWERTKKLHESGTKVVTENEYEIALANYLAMARRVEKLKNAYKLMVDGPRKEKIDAARADVGQAEADLAKAQWRLDNTIVKAPVSGTILQKNAEEGNIVNPVVFNGSYSICKMANLSDLEVDLTIQERDISHVFKGQYCQVHTDAYPNRLYDGYVSRLMPTADRAKGAIPVRVKLSVPPEEEGVYLKPEMGAIVSFYEKKWDKAPGAGSP